MTRFIQEGPMWRRALISMAAMLSLSAAFVGVVMLVLGSVVDMAVAPASTDSIDGPDTPTANADSKTAPKTEEGPKGPGERS